MASKTPQTPRRWSEAILYAAAITLAIVVLTAIVNPLFDRGVNWGMLAGLSILVFAGLVTVFRRRWF